MQTALRFIAAAALVFGFSAVHAADWHPEKPVEIISGVAAGGTRLHSRAEGISHVIVNGRTVFRDNQHTGELPGVVLRSR